MYDHNTQSVQFYLKDLERQAMECIDMDGSGRTSFRSTVISMVAACGIAIGLIGIIGSTPSV